MPAIPSYAAPLSSSGGFWTTDQIARQLTDGYWASAGMSRRSFDVGQGQTLTADISDLNAQGQHYARMAFSAWSQITGIRFDTSSRAGGAADIRVINDNPQGAYSQQSWMSGSIQHAVVNIPTSWYGDPAAGLSTYGYQTFLHEIGHALGLGHTGNYNGGAIYGRDNLFANDSWQASLMSYFSQSDNTAINASHVVSATPMLADIAAIQSLYGVPAGLFAGATIWGVNGTAGGGFGAAMAQLVRGAAVGVTLLDQGGIDTLDLRNDTRDQRIDLAPGRISDVYGRIGNLSIERTTMIERAVAGSGSDHVTGNRAPNTLYGMAGNDTLAGLAGNDTLTGGSGRDRLIGGLGNDIYVSDGADQIVEAAGAGYDTMQAWGSLAMHAHVEAARVMGSRALNVWGNGLSNSITGNAAANQLSGGNGNDTLLGLGGNDRLIGGDGNDFLSGQVGVDTLQGGAGNDVYVHDGTDLIVEAAASGYDTVRTTTHLHMQAHVEAAVVLGTAALNVTGNALSNRITGNGGANLLVGGAGNDVLVGQLGADTLRGGTGNDVYVSDGLDLIVEAAGEGYDTVRTTAHLRMQDHIENAVVLGAGARNVVGNGLSNGITGNIAANQLTGGGGNDRLHGLGGHDLLVGGVGNDLVVGGTGNDTLLGGAGNDQLVGGPGYDVMRGDAGADMFVFRTDEGGRVLDFQDDVDRVELRRGPGYETATAASVLADAENTAGGARFSFGSTVILITGATIASLHDDLILA